VWSIYVIVTVGVLVGLFVFCTLKKSNEKQKNEDRENFVKILGFHQPIQIIGLEESKLSLREFL
jgi:heme/copper-type cytochrome/quinol oxidase subunit 2